jgi:hypothetical protein
MKRFTKALFLIGVMVLLMAFASSSGHSLVQQTEPTETASFTVDKIHSSAAYYSQSVVYSVVFQKSDDCVRYFEKFSIALQDFRINSSPITFFKQDINRYLSVSPLLFPFHIFW